MTDSGTSVTGRPSDGGTRRALTGDAAAERIIALYRQPGAAITAVVLGHTAFHRRIQLPDAGEIPAEGDLHAPSARPGLSVKFMQAQASEWPADPKDRLGDDAFNRHVFVESAMMAEFHLMPYRGAHNLALEDSPTWRVTRHVAVGASGRYAFANYGAAAGFELAHTVPDSDLVVVAIAAEVGEFS